MRALRVITRSGILILLLSVFGFATAQTRTASNSGLWSSTDTWGTASVPTSVNDVFIDPGITVTVDEAAECASLEMDASPSSSTITISGNNSLTISGLLTMQRPGSSDLATINVNAGTLSCGSLAMEATISSQNDIINITTGTFSVSGATTTGTTGCLFNITSTGSITFAGSLSGEGVMTTAAGSNVSYTGNLSQYVIGGTYDGSLTITGDGYKVLAGSTTINGNLVLSEGTLENGSDLIIGNGATITRSQGSLAAAPTFSGTVDLVYTGESPITTSYEMPLDASSLNNLTSNAGGLAQGGSPGAVVNILTDAFGNTNSWTGDLGRSYNQFRTVNSSNAGGSSSELRYAYGYYPSVFYTNFIYRMINTSGYVSLNINWKQFIDNYDSDAYFYTIKLQCATSSSGTWTDMDSYTPTGTEDIGPETKRITNWTTNVGGDFYVRIYIEGYTYGLNFLYLDDLIIDGQDPTVPSTVTVNGNLDLSNGTYAIEDNTLDIAGTVSGSSSLVGGAESALIVSGAGSNLTLPNLSGGLNNFTISRGNGVSLANDLSLNGILDLSSSNPSASQGLLETGTDTLTMAESATTTGTGDVSGFVKRTSFNANTTYTFGNEFTSIVFGSEGTYPSKVLVKIALGASPTWLTSAINRVYDFVQTGGVDCNATISSHYLESELNSLDESGLTQWTNGTPGPPEDLNNWGKSSNSTTDNWVSIANVGIENFPTVFGQLESTLAADEPASFVWNGSLSTDWSTEENWSPNGTPSWISNIVIPNASTTTYDPTLPASASLNTLTIQSGGILNSSASAVLTLNGDNGAWSNEGGTFNAGTSNVLFTDESATISGTTDFYDITVDDEATLTPGTDCYTGIANSIILTGTGIIQAVRLHNTIDYNGGSQTVIEPGGSTAGYHTLVLSGTGTKTFPSGALSIYGDLVMSGTASASAAGAFTIAGSLALGSGNTLDLGSYTHTLGGDFTDAGSTLTSASSSLMLNGSSEQTLSRSTGLSFDDLSISNTDASIVLGTSTSCSLAGDLTVDEGAVFDLGANALNAVGGTVSNSGTIKTQNSSASPVPAGISWGGVFELNGSLEQTMVLGTYNDLTISGYGASAIADITVNGILSLLSPNVSSSQGLLDMGSSTVLFGPASTCIGEGEVTGIMRRTTLLPETYYSYGHKYTYVYFPDVGTLPSEMSVKLTLGSPPDWKASSIDRVYDLAQTGGTGTQAILYSHYLDSEMNLNTEGDLVDFVHFTTPSQVVEYGRSSNDTVANWLVISNVDLVYFADEFGQNEISFGDSELQTLTWNGSTSSSWVTASNWTPAGAPSDSTEVTIPDAITTNYDLEIPALATCKSITIESGGIMNSSAGGNVSLNGNGSSFSNSGTFNPGTGTITFTGIDARLTGTNDFHGINIEVGAGLYLESGSYLGVTGDITNFGALNATEAGPTTIEYKGADQLVASTDRLSDLYSTVLFSGSGIKTLPSVPMVIEAVMGISGTANVLADTSITFNGPVNIGTGSTFTAGSETHTFMGNLTVDGTLNASESHLIFGGSDAQIISGSSAITIDTLTVDNPLSLTLSSEGLTTVSEVLTINDGMKLFIAPNHYLTAAGTLTNNSDSTGLVIQSDETGSGSLIHSSAGVEATVQRYIEANVWHIYSPAVTDQSTPGFLSDVQNNIPTKTGIYGMMYYDEAGGGWEYFPIPSTGTMSHGGGYLLRHTTDDAVSVYGDLNEVTRDVTLTRASNGWNCIGNPFPSSIGVRVDAGTSEDFLTYNAEEFDPSYASLYMWDPPEVPLDGVDYYKLINNASFTSSRPILDMEYLQPGQGFIVKSASGGATVSFTPGMRVHDDTRSYLKKAARASWPGIVLSVSSEDKTASTSITFNDRMSMGLDITYDAGLFGGDAAFRIYTRLVEDNGENFMLQCLPDYEFDEMIVPIGLDCSFMGNISFTAENIDLPPSCGIFLEDRKYGTVVNLNGEGAEYIVQLDSVSKGPGRFFLRFEEEKASGMFDKDEDAYQVFYRPSEIVVRGNTDFASRARLVDITGRTLRVYELGVSPEHILPAAGLQEGVYLLQLYGGTFMKSSKILIE